MKKSNTTPNSTDKILFIKNLINKIIEYIFIFRSWSFKIHNFTSGIVLNWVKNLLKFIYRFSRIILLITGILTISQTTKHGMYEYLLDLFNNIREYFYDNFQSSLKSIRSFLDGLIKEKSDKILDNISDHLENINNFFINLTPEQNFALFNFSGTFVIFVTIINILFIFYGNKLIDYFNLEIRFPRLAFLINLRRKFQQYYLLWNTFIIFIVSLIMLFVNLLMIFN